MDRSPVSPLQRPREQVAAAAKKRLQTYQMKRTAPPPSDAPASPMSHTRSHSRSGSSSSIPIPKSVSEPANLGSRSRPNSTHKRNSSVSTRRESAELMGVTLPADDEVSRDTDPVRRALAALEGKHSASPRNSFVNRMPTVQIPDLDAVPPKGDASELRKPFALNSSLAGKRDSFGKLLARSSSPKVELGTLVEEEEEDEENVAPSPAQPSPITLAVPVPMFPKPRPGNLNLRPLSLTTQSLVPQALVLTPSPTPHTPSPRPGLKSLTLTSSPSVCTSPPPSRRPPPTTPLLPPSSTTATVPPRKSSIGYKRSPEAVATPRPTVPTRPTWNGLLTPEPTPTSASPDMSPTRRAFIYQSHSALVSRVSDLEQLLATARTPSPRPPPPASPTPSVVAENEEFLAMIADLKAERDELKREVENWRVRVAGLEKQTATLTTRVESERRQAWVVKEQLGVLEIEKAGIEHEGNKLKATIDQLNEQVSTLQRDLDEVRRERDEAQASLVTARPAKPASGLKFVAHSQNGLGFRSIDSLSSTTDVDDLSSQRSSFASGFPSALNKLKVVDEVREHDEVDNDDGDELSRYDDDQESEPSFYSPSRNSSISILPDDSPMSPTDPIMPHASLRHQRKSSLTKAWTFGGAAKVESQPQEVDRFFVCLEDPDQEDEYESEPEEPTRNLPKLGFGFGHGFSFGRPADEDEDDMPPFVLPTQSKSFAVPYDEADDDDTAINFAFPAAKAAKPLVRPSSPRTNAPSSRTPPPVPRDAPPAVAPVLKPVVSTLPPSRPERPIFTPPSVSASSSASATTVTNNRFRVRPLLQTALPITAVDALSPPTSPLSLFSSILPASPTLTAFAHRLSLTWSSLDLDAFPAPPPVPTAAPASREAQLARLRASLPHHAPRDLCACAHCRGASVHL